ncbi:hypothetical protein [Acanthopleuribacter pedis]|uniref:Uncharacterized protein n=1 Tax=Acanthopleuribacter pedis TaxID=442870 RepID=A0A8J7U1K9_9BACT|nr:hypothetical protein [Acanthopleuribacter pedis]MBO1318303.1 hypothetical protein [Acanthopleuribacter pedis]
MRILVTIITFILAASVPVWSQTRVNTSKAAEALNREADKAHRKAQRLKSEELRLLSKIERLEMAERAAEQQIKESQRKIDEITKKQIANLTDIVWKLMTDEVAGPILQQEPALIKQMDAMKALLTDSPSLSPVVDELMFQWTGKRI